ncbi:hypothetical protein IAR55_006271 [Kwoniella newhampshirensis]|uniref:Ribosome assembly protein 3 n=1 Tax=Kwoniella newhampshirensis TaxID=1651941 RepID=A0AAW0YGL8_9TREE
MSKTSEGGSSDKSKGGGQRRRSSGTSDRPSGSSSGGGDRDRRRRSRSGTSASGTDTEAGSSSTRSGRRRSTADPATSTTDTAGGVGTSDFDTALTKWIKAAEDLMNSEFDSIKDTPTATDGLSRFGETMKRLGGSFLPKELIPHTDGVAKSDKDKSDYTNKTYEETRKIVLSDTSVSKPTASTDEGDPKKAEGPSKDTKSAASTDATTATTDASKSEGENKAEGKKEAKEEEKK